ncbi:MAG: cell division protein [Rhodospirillales bacterium]|nr:cell division protein [Rhodospirillales bacterium]
MFFRRIDIALDQDAHARFLPLLIAFMVYLAILAVAGIMVLNHSIERWDKGISGTLTVQIPPPQDSAINSDATTSAVNDALRVLSNTPGVLNAEVLAEDETLELLRPWLGELAGQADLPLPRLIDVAIDRESGVDTQALSRQLSVSVPGASVDDHRVWLDRLVRLLKTVELIALGVVAVIGFVTIGTVIFTTRTGLALHSEAIQVLHLIGAHDNYIARQFAGRALWLGLKGGLVGLIFCVPTLLAIGYLAERMQIEAIPNISLGVPQMVAIIVLPLIVAGIAMVTARVTVLRTLARMP